MSNKHGWTWYVACSQASTRSELIVPVAESLQRLYPGVWRTKHHLHFPFLEITETSACRLPSGQPG